MVNQITKDYKRADISSDNMAMLDYSVDLTRHPARISKNDVDELREHGFSDAAILYINQIAGYFNFANRLVDGLGVELENYWPQVE